MGNAPTVTGKLTQGALPTRCSLSGPTAAAVGFALRADAHSALLAPPYFSPNQSVAMVRNEKNPTMSVTVVTNGLEATAGSRPRR